MRVAASLALAVTTAALAGCASFNSMPDPVITRVAADSMIQPIPVRTAITGMPAQIAAGTGKQYRNEIIASYLAAADAHYLDFLASLSRQVKGSNFALDVAALGLSSVSAIAHTAAKELATGAAIATGARTSLDKEVYFEKTLPAIVSAMEARRLEVRSQIEIRMKQEDVDKYTLEEGFADIMRYQMATTVDGAIQELTTSAGEEEAAAAERYKGAVEACNPPAGVGAKWATLNRGLRKQNVKLAEIAKTVGAASSDDPNQQISSIMEAVEHTCTAEAVDAAIALLPPGGK